MADESKAPKGEAKVVAMVERDRWTEAGRMPKGELVEVTNEELLAGLENGSLSRVK